MKEYRQDPRGFLVRITPKTFRRGRIKWTGGHCATAEVPSGGKKGLTKQVSVWTGAKPHDPKRVKHHTKA